MCIRDRAKSEAAQAKAEADAAKAENEALKARLKDAGNYLQEKGLDKGVDAALDGLFNDDGTTETEQPETGDVPDEFNPVPENAVVDGDREASRADGGPGSGGRTVESIVRELLANSRQSRPLGPREQIVSFDDMSEDQRQSCRDATPSNPPPPRPTAQGPLEGPVDRLTSATRDALNQQFQQDLLADQLQQDATENTAPVSPVAPN